VGVARLGGDADVAVVLHAGPAEDPHGGADARAVDDRAQRPAGAGGRDGGVEDADALLASAAIHDAAP
jgi:hypothetical protein